MDDGACSSWKGRCQLSSAQLNPAYSPAALARCPFLDFKPQAKLNLDAFVAYVGTM